MTYYHLNSLAPGGFENIFQNVFFKLISWIDTLSNSCETALRSMPQNPSDDKSTLVQVMAWCRQAASHYLSQCCPRSLSPYGVTRPQWVNSHIPQYHVRWWPGDAKNRSINSHGICSFSRNIPGWAPEESQPVNLTPVIILFSRGYCQRIQPFDSNISQAYPTKL